MGRRQNRKKTRRVKNVVSGHITGCSAEEPRELNRKANEYRKCIPEINLQPADYNLMSEIGKAALDNVIALTGRTKEEILMEA